MMHFCVKNVTCSECGEMFTAHAMKNHVCKNDSLKRKRSECEVEFVMEKRKKI
jgi:formylmethanofuran dehydrogenase subunit E